MPITHQTWMFFSLSSLADLKIKGMIRNQVTARVVMRKVAKHSPRCGAGLVLLPAERWVSLSCWAGWMSREMHYLTQHGLDLQKRCILMDLYWLASLGNIEHLRPFGIGSSDLLFRLAWPGQCRGCLQHYQWWTSQPVIFSRTKRWPGIWGFFW